MMMGGHVENARTRVNEESRNADWLVAKRNSNYKNN